MPGSPFKKEKPFCVSITPTRLHWWAYWFMCFSRAKAKCEPIGLKGRRLMCKLSERPADSVYPQWSQPQRLHSGTVSQCFICSRIRPKGDSFPKSGTTIFTELDLFGKEGMFNGMFIIPVYGYCPNNCKMFCMENLSVLRLSTFYI